MIYGHGKNVYGFWSCRFWHGKFSVIKVRGEIPWTILRSVPYLWNGVYRANRKKIHLLTIRSSKCALEWTNKNGFLQILLWTDMNCPNAFSPFQLKVTKATHFIHSSVNNDWISTVDHFSYKISWSIYSSCSQMMLLLLLNHFDGANMVMVNSMESNGVHPNEIELIPTAHPVWKVYLSALLTLTQPKKGHFWRPKIGLNFVKSRWKTRVAYAVSDFVIYVIFVQFVLSNDDNSFMIRTNNLHARGRRRDPVKFTRIFLPLFFFYQNHIRNVIFYKSWLFYRNRTLSRMCHICVIKFLTIRKCYFLKCPQFVISSQHYRQNSHILTDANIISTTANGLRSIF